MRRQFPRVCQRGYLVVGKVHTGDQLKILAAPVADLGAVWGKKERSHVFMSALLFINAL